MEFEITLHSHYSAPRDALDTLWARLGTTRDDARFERDADSIRATWGEDVPISMERDERQQVGRLAVLEIVRDVCDESSELAIDWYAISPRR